MKQTKKITIIEQPGSEYKGEDVLKLPPLTVLRVCSHIEGNCLGNLVMRTMADREPFIDLTDGSIWGEHLENYSFEVAISYSLDVVF